MNIHQAILEVLKGHVGKENRIARDVLRQDVARVMLGLSPKGYDMVGHDGFPHVIPNFSDREMRAAIEELRRSHPIGALICSSSGSGGYGLAESYEEVLQSYREERRRAMSLMYTMRNRLDAAKRYFAGQMELGL